MNRCLGSQPATVAYDECVTLFWLPWVLWNFRVLHVCLRAYVCTQVPVCIGRQLALAHQCVYKHVHKHV